MNTTWQEHSITNEKGPALKCKRCGTETNILFPDKIQVLVCPKCRSAYSKVDAARNKISKYKYDSVKRCIELYSKCTFFGKDYTVVSATRKREVGGHYNKWIEYGLITTSGELAYLNESYGHWSFFTECERPKNYNESDSTLNNDDSLSYELLATYKYIAESSSGQFYYDLLTSNTRQIREYTNPPHVFTHEKLVGADEYFKGIYITENHLRRAFEVELSNVPEKDGVGDYQPFYMGIKPLRFGRLSLVVFLLALVAHLIYSPPSSSEKTILKLRAELNDSVKTTKLVSTSFVVEEPRPVELEFDLSSNLYNDWIEAGVTVINDITGEEKYFISGLEYYGGTDDEGNWSEGSNVKKEYVGNISPGTWHIEAEVTGAVINGRSKYLEANVIQGSASSWNFWIIMVIYCSITVLILIIGSNFENKRASA